MFGTFNDPNASSEQAVEAQINKMGAEVGEEEEHASEVLDKSTEPYYCGGVDTTPSIGS